MWPGYRHLSPVWVHGEKNSKRAFLVGSISVTGTGQPTPAVTLRAKVIIPRGEIVGSGGSALS